MTRDMCVCARAYTFSLKYAAVDFFLPSFALFYVGEPYCTEMSSVNIHISQSQMNNRHIKKHDKNEQMDKTKEKSERERENERYNVLPTFIVLTRINCITTATMSNDKTNGQVKLLRKRFVEPNERVHTPQTLCVH